MSAHAIVQEFINLNEQLYGLVTNGRVLRLLRNSSRLIKLSYLEFDLDRIFTDGLFPTFAVLYRLLHATRLPLSDETSKESWIERYHQDSIESGARIRDGLSSAVEAAIRAFGTGFLNHPANNALHDAVVNGGLRPSEYYNNLLRLIYRLLFLMVIEERDLVFPPPPRRSSGTSTASITACSGCGSSQSIVTLPIIAGMTCGWRCCPPSGSSRPTGPARSWASPRWLATSSATRRSRCWPLHAGQ
jgi:hypothetical protein